jgi:Peptidase S24-like
VPLQPEDLLNRNATAAARALDPAPTINPVKNIIASAAAPAPVPSRVPSITDAYTTRLELAAEVLHRFGEVRFVAYGSSMVPSIYPGDLLTIRSDSVSDARRGDIVLFLLCGRPYVHRVTRKWPERNRIAFATRGDSLPKEDRSVDASQLLGRVTAIQRRGKQVAIVAKPGKLIRAHRWAVRNSQQYTRLLLAVHALRMRLAGRSTDFADRSASDHLQGFA